MVFSICKHRFSDKEELDALDHALRFVLSGSHDDDTEPSLRLLDARIDAAQSRVRRSRLRRWLYPAAAAVIAIVSTVGLTMSFTHGSNVQRYANNGEAAIMVGLPDGTLEHRGVGMDRGGHVVGAVGGRDIPGGAVAAAGRRDAKAKERVLKCSMPIILSF